MGVQTIIFMQFSAKKKLSTPILGVGAPLRKILDPPLTCASPSTSTVIVFVEMDLLLCPDSALKFFGMFYSQQTSLHVSLSGVTRTASIVKFQTFFTVQFHHMMDV